ncbi:MAG: 4-hydroxy-3-methylbut-2-enyl diphosphate reductase [Thermodesulfobacteria bacterium]|nr:4-hydroxy-3-methylbut-2-enyl diphosphate reductase [Thermodesulfobacteriota bacterium]
MKIKIARNAGFCMGVRRAVNLVLKAISEKKSPIYTYGPLIHNPQTLALLDKLGVKVIKNPEESCERGVCIIRAHGTSPEEKSSLKKRHEVIDGTCPRVLRVQALAKKAASQGKWVIIIGDKNHAEVKGILAHAGDKGLVVSSEEDIKKLPEVKDCVILSQTTQNQKKFEELSEKILKKCKNCKVINTICNATEKRQSEVIKLSKECEAIVVIGGKFSANTNRLAEIAKARGKEVYLVEKPEELDLEKVKTKKSIGITAGASTPNWLINEVVDHIKVSCLVPYRILKAFSFLSFLFVLNFFLMFSGFLNFVNYPFDLKRLWFSSFVFFFLLFRYNLDTLLQREQLFNFYSVKAKSVTKHLKLIKFITVISVTLSVISGFMFNPQILGVIIGLIFLDQVLKDSPLNFLWEVIFLGAIGLYLYPYWKEPTFSFLFLEVLLLILFIRFYLEIVYFQTDGFLPKSFIISSLGYREELIYKIMKVIIGFGVLCILPLIKTSGFFLSLILVWLVGYIMVKGLKARPLGQIIYLETLSLTMPTLFFLLSIIKRFF